MILLVYYGRKSIHQRTITKIIVVGCGGFGFGCLIWFITVYLLVAIPWTPLYVLPPELRLRTFLPLLLPSCGITAIILYRIGKKRDWIPHGY